MIYRILQNYNTQIGQKNLITNRCDEYGELCVCSLKLLQSENNGISASLLYNNPKLNQKIQTLPPIHQRLSCPLETIETK